MGGRENVGWVDGGRAHSDFLEVKNGYIVLLLKKFFKYYLQDSMSSANGPLTAPS